MEEEIKSKPSHGTQYLAAISASVGAMAVGAAIRYSSPAGAALRWRNSTQEDAGGSFHLDKEERSWFAGILSVGALLGCVLAGCAVRAIGRKGTMMASVAPLALGWILIGVARDLPTILCGRLLCGLSTGATSLVVPTYTTEFASRDIRGTLGSGFQLLVTVGVLYAYAFGTVVESWRFLALVCGAIALLYLPLAALLKESPHYLLAKGREEEARRSLQHFRGKSYDIEKELQDLKDSIEMSSEAKVSIRDLMAPNVLKPLIIALFLMIFQQLAGVNAVVFNINIIFQDAGSSVSEDASIIIIGIIQVLSTAASTFLIDRAGRKLLLSVSSGVMTVSISCLGVFFYAKEVDEEWALATMAWLPLASLMFFSTSFCIGYGSIPWVMMGELFEPGVKEAAASLATTVNWTCVFVVTFTFEPLQDAIHDYGVYWLFGSICFVNFVFCRLFVPETKGKTLQEITAHFGSPTAS